MKVMFPQNIKKGFFSGMAFNIMGFSISFIQLIVLAIGVVLGLGAFSAFNNSGAKLPGILSAGGIIIIFAFIAFFEQSELNLPAFIAKKIKDCFLDVPKKVQMNYVKLDPTEIAISKAKQDKGKQRIEIKGSLDSEALSRLDKGGIL